MQMPGEKLLEKMWGTVAEKGIGGLFKPWQMRREGRVSIDLKREELLAIAQAEHDAERIRRGEIRLPDAPSLLLVAGASADGSVHSEPDRPALPLLATEVMVAEAVRKEANVTRALLHAEEALERDDQAPPDNDIDEDWLFRWRDSASQVSNEELQNLWGRVLAGEFKAPGSFSLRTLEFLKNITQPEAEAIAKLSRFVLGGIIYREAKEIFEDEGMTFAFLLKMQHLGVVAGVDALGLNITWGSVDRSRFVRQILSNSMVIVATHEDPSKQLSLPVYQVTFIGEEVLRLGTFEPHVPYLEKVGERLKSEGFEVELASYREIGPNQIQYFDGRKL